MHPPLDRPHPDCQDVIAALHECHKHMWKKYTGGCNETKLSLDHCLKLEKERLMNERNKDLPERRLQQEEMIKQAFEKKETLQEYLEKDRDYVAEMEKKRQREQQ
jgi:COX assembly mitochondrial protein 2